MTLSFSEPAWTSPEPKGPNEWGGPKPDGYEWPPGSMQLGAFLVCDRCGGAVASNVTERHDAWHESVLTNARLADVIERKRSR